MRILLLVTRAERGGAQTHVADLIRSFHARGWEVALGVGEEGYLCQEARRTGCPVFLIDGLLRAVNPRGDLKALLHTVRLIREWKPDLVHAHSSKAGLIARVAGRVARTPVIWTAHNWGFELYRSQWSRRLFVGIERMAGRLGGIIITVSEAVRQRGLAAGIGTEELMVTVLNGVADIPLHRRPVSPRPAVRIVTVARFAHPKDHAALIHALALLDCPYELICIGDGPLRRSVESLAERLGMGERVRFLGERNDVAELLEDADIFALATHSEGLPLSILEAMRAGLPVIASAVGGVPEAVVDGENGLLVRPGDVEDLRDKLQLLAVSATLRRSMGLRSRELYESRFVLGKMVDSVAILYEHLLHTPGVPIPRTAAWVQQASPDGWKQDAR